MLNILPAAVAERLKAGQSLIADCFPEATILFADLHDFSRLTAGLAAADVVKLLNGITSRADGPPWRRRSGVAYAPALSSMFPVGVTPVVCTTWGSDGMTNRCSFTVTGQASAAPVFAGCTVPATG